MLMKSLVSALVATGFAASLAFADMAKDSPVKFPEKGALPAKYAPDRLSQEHETAEKDYAIFSTPERSLEQINRIQAEMPRGEFTPPPQDWPHLARTRKILTEGGELRLLAMGDSIVNDTMRSGWVAKLGEAYPKAKIRATVYVRGGGGCQHYKEEGRVAKYVVPRKPDLVFIGGISQKDTESIRAVIRELRAALPDVEILLATGTFGTADPRVPEELAKAAHSGTGRYGEALKKLAAEERCAYLDMTTPWAEYIRSSKLHPHLFYRDVVHANEYGEQILAKILMAFFRQGEPRLKKEPVSSGAVISRQQIEADWLRQEQVRRIGASPAPNPANLAVTAEQDAAGAVDGVKDGRWGFHTGADEKPWWQVDLQQLAALDHLLIYNRGDDGPAAARAGHLQVLLSSDGKQWKQVYEHDGKVFYGHVDKKPLKVALGGAQARYVRIQLPTKGYLHFDEVEIYPRAQGTPKNLALGKPATQSSTSPWSRVHAPAAPAEDPANKPSISGKELAAATDKAIQRGRLLAASLRGLGAAIDEEQSMLDSVARRAKGLPADAPAEARKPLYLEARWAVRAMTLKNPLLDFEDLLFVKRVPGSFTHMSDQYYGWFSRPGGGLYVLEGVKTASPRLRCLSDSLPPGSVLRPDLSYDGRRVLFAHCKFYPGLAEENNKLDKDRVPEDAFYHLYEINLDGSGLRRLTRGKYDDFDGRYLPDGRIVFLSTRRGRFVQCGKTTAAERQDGAGGDCYVRCGGGPERPVAVYTLHAMDADGRNLMPLSPFEMFEWTPSVDQTGRIIYARWDYVDRANMPFMKLWSTLPDGTNPQALFGNFTLNPHTAFEVRAIPNSHKLIFTAGAHHAFTGGSLVLLDPRQGLDGERPMKRLTPEVCFAETEGWPATYFAGPYPLSEEHYLVSWSDQPLPPGVPHPDWGMPGPPNDLGLYLFDAFGNLNLLYRDPEIGSETPLPIKPRSRPPEVASQIDGDAPMEGRMLLVDVYRGLGTIPRGTIRNLRLVGVPPKTHPTMNSPSLGITSDDPGKFVLGTVPVEEDGSAWFHVPAGVTIFFQALDAKGMAVQTMRSGFYVQPGQTASCIGCHEHRSTAPPSQTPLALRRGPSPIKPGPEGSWPLDFRALVQPVIEKHCVSCHKPGETGGKFDLTAARAYQSLVDYGKPSLAAHVRARYQEGRSLPGAGAAATSALVPFLEPAHGARLGADDWDRLITWMDAYGQRTGSFDKLQEDELRALRARMAPLLAK